MVCHTTDLGDAEKPCVWNGKSITIKWMGREFLAQGISVPGQRKQDSGALSSRVLLSSHFGQGAYSKSGKWLWFPVSFKIYC